nr:RHS repeat-associated core domain-containing protein [Hahella sp. HN01]
MQEVVNGAKQVSYVYGDDLLSQARAGDVSYYVYDGQGSVRSLTNQTGTQTDSYHYDAFGILLHSEGDTPNSYLYTGEQYDAVLDQYYLRARYYDQNQGRFTQMDTWMGVNSDPITLHKYLYANADSGNLVDPSGNFSIGSMMSAVNTAATLASRVKTAYTIFNLATGKEELTAKQIGAQILFNLVGGKFTGLFRKGCNSFDADTLVHTEQGLKPITDLKIGDMALSYNEVTGEGAEVVILGPGRYGRLIKTDKMIGYDAKKGSVTQYMSVVTNETGNILTATPGKIVGL